MGRPNRDGINSLSGVVNQESAWRLKSPERIGACEICVAMRDVGPDL